jgi:hypothetical protein
LLCLFKNRNREAGEAHGQHNLLIYIWRTRSHLGNLEHCCFSRRLVLRFLPLFFGVFSQGQIPNHTGTVLSWGLCLSSLELSHKAKCQITQVKSHCWLQQYITCSFKYIAKRQWWCSLGVLVLGLFAFRSSIALFHLYSTLQDNWLLKTALPRLPQQLPSCLR